MSKAFLRESEFGDLPDLPPPPSLLPVGARNYLTAAGAQKLRGELERLIQVERPSLSSAALHDGDAKRELQSLDHRIRYLQQSLASAEIVDPPAEDTDLIRFGATVTVRDAQGTTSTYRLVGVDETDLDQGCVSWMSPLARALLNRRRGDRVSFISPSGVKQLEILQVAYGDGA